MVTLGGKRAIEISIKLELYFNDRWRVIFQCQCRSVTNGTNTTQQTEYSKHNVADTAL